MYARSLDHHLQSEVIRAILKDRPDLRRDVVVIALEDGSVTLRGTVASVADSQQLEAIARQVPTAREVFCHVVIRDRKPNNEEVTCV